MRKKIILVVCVSFLLIFAISACGDKEMHQNTGEDVNIHRKPVMTLSEKEEIANNLIMKFMEYDAYFQTHSFYELTKNSVVMTDYFNDDILEFIYNATKLYDYYIGINGVYREVISEEDMNKFVNTHCDWFFSDRIRYGYTETGAHIIVILPIDNLENSLWYDAMNKIRGDFNESDILDPINSIIDVYVEDLTQKAQTYDISVKVKGFAIQVDSEGNAEGNETITYFPTRTDIPDKVKETLKSYGRDINSESTIEDQTWKLFMVDKGDYNRFWPSEIEVTLDGEVIQLQPIDS